MSAEWMRARRGRTGYRDRRPRREAEGGRVDVEIRREQQPEQPQPPRRLLGPRRGERAAP